MATTTNDGSGWSYVSGTAYASTANAYDGSATTYATLTTTTAGAHVNDITGYNFSAIVPSDGTLTSVVVNVQQYETTLIRWDPPTIQAYDGVTAIGTAATLTERTSAGSENVTLSSVTLAQIRSANFKLRYTANKLTTTSNVAYFGWANVTVTYSPPNTTLTVSNPVHAVASGLPTLESPVILVVGNAVNTTTSVESPITGLSARWKASDLSAVGDNNQVSSWTDRINGWTVAETDNRPYFDASVPGLNSKPAVLFDRASNLGLWTDTNTPLLRNLSGYTVFVVWRTSPTDGGDLSALSTHFCIANGNQGGERIDIGHTSDLHSRVSNSRIDGVGQTVNVGTATIAVDTSYADTVIIDHSTDKLNTWQNGAADIVNVTLNQGIGNTSDLDSSAASIGCQWISGSTPGWATKGGISEVLVYQRTLTDTERGQIHSYINDEYGITVSDYISPGYYPEGGPVKLIQKSSLVVNSAIQPVSSTRIGSLIPPVILAVNNASQSVSSAYDEETFYDNFERGSPALNDTFDNNIDNWTGAYATWSSNGGIDGSGAMRIAASGGQITSLVQGSRITASQNDVVIVSVRSYDTLGNSQWLYVVAYNSGGTAISSKRVLVGSADWRYSHTGITAPVNTASIGVYIENPSSGYNYIDNVSIWKNVSPGASWNADADFVIADGSLSLGTKSLERVAWAPSTGSNANWVSSELPYTVYNFAPGMLVRGNNSLASATAYLFYVYGTNYTSSEISYQDHRFAKIVSGSISIISTPPAQTVYSYSTGNATNKFSSNGSTLRYYSASGSPGTAKATYVMTDTSIASGTYTGLLGAAVTGNGNGCTFWPVFSTGFTTPLVTLKHGRTLSVNNSSQSVTSGQRRLYRNHSLYRSHSQYRVDALALTQSTTGSIDLAVNNSSHIVSSSGMRFADDFNRSDAATLGSNWYDPDSVASVLSNEMKWTGYNKVIWVDAPSQSYDNMAKTMVVMGASSLAIRGNKAATPGATIAYIFGYSGSSNAWKTQKIISGSLTLLGSDYIFAPSGSDQIVLYANGSNIKSILNGSTAVSVTDTDISIGLYQGLYNGGINLGTLDGFEAGDILPPVILKQASGLVVNNGSQVVSSTSPALVQNKTLVVSNAAQPVASTTPALVHNRTLSVNNAAQAAASTSPSLIHNRTISVNSAVQPVSSTGPALIHNRTLVVNSGSQTLASSSPALSAALSLVVPNGLNAVSSTSPALIQGYILSVFNASQALVSQSPSLVHNETLSVNNCSQSLSSTSPQLVKNITVAVNSATQTVVSTSPSLVHNKALVVFNSQQTLASTSASLALTFILSVNNASQSVITTAPVLIENRTLSVQPGSQSVSSTSPVVSSVLSLVVSNASNALSSTSPLIVQAYTLSVSVSSQVVTSSSLTIVHNRTLVISNSSQVLASDSPALVVNKFINVGSCTQALASGSVVLTLNIGQVVQAGIQAVTSTSPVLVHNRMLSVNSTAQTLSSTSTDLIHNKTIAVSNTAQALSSTSPALIVSKTLAVSNGANTVSSGPLTLTQRHTLGVSSGSNTLTSTSILLGQLGLLVVSNGDQPMSSTSLALTQQHILSASPGSQALASTSPVLVHNKTLSVQSCANIVQSGSVALVLRYTLSIANAVNNVASGSISITMDVALSATSAANALLSTSPALVQNKALAVSNGANALSSGTPALTQRHMLAVASASNAVTSTVIFLGIEGVLETGSTQQGLTSTSPVITQRHMLATANSANTNASTSPALVHNKTLAVQPGAQQVSSPPVTLVQRFTVSIADSAQPVSSASITLVHNRMLVVSDSANVVSSTSPVLVHHRTLAAANSANALSSTQAVLTQRHILVVASSSQGATSSSVVLISEGTLPVNNASQALSSTGIALTQRHALQVQASAQALASTQPSPVLNRTLSVANTSQKVASTSPALTLSKILSVSSTAQFVASTSVAITQRYILVVSSAVDSLSSTSPAVLSTGTLSVASSAQALSSTRPVLAYELASSVAPGLQPVSSTSPALIQVHIVVVNDSDHSVDSSLQSLGTRQFITVDSTTHHITDITIVIYIHRTDKHRKKHYSMNAVKYSKNQNWIIRPNRRLISGP